MMKHWDRLNDPKEARPFSDKPSDHNSDIWTTYKDVSGPPVPVHRLQHQHFLDPETARAIGKWQHADPDWFPEDAILSGPLPRAAMLKRGAGVSRRRAADQHPLTSRSSIRMHDDSIQNDSSSPEPASTSERHTKQTYAAAHVEMSLADHVAARLFVKQHPGPKPPHGPAADKVQVRPETSM